jgi:glycosyltransferase involved in cell wall biosynthesis
MSTPVVSVIVPVYNGAATIEGCLRSLEAQTVREHEVIVVDDGSTDDTASIVERTSSRLVRLEENTGPAAARNAGIAAARSHVIAFTDADCVAAPDWLARALARLEAEPDAAGVEGRTEPAGETSALTHQMRNAEGGLYMTCNMIYRRAALEQVGGFDERFRLAWLEDSDVALGLLEAGGRIAWDPTVLVSHLVLPRGRGRFLHEARKRFYNPLLFRKHPQAYREHITPVVPGLPPMHLKYIAATIAPFIAWAIRLPGLAVLLAMPWLFYARRVLHAYRARDPITALAALAHPFVQTFWVLAGSLRFKAFTLDL